MLSPTMEPTDKMPSWKKCDRWERAIDCARFLTLHGLMSDRERSNFDRRLKRWLAKHDLGLVDKGSMLAHEASRVSKESR